MPAPIDGQQAPTRAPIPAIGTFRPRHRWDRPFGQAGPHPRDGAPVTLAGSAFAQFDADGLIAEARDYWHQTAGHLPPPNSLGRG